MTTHRAAPRRRTSKSLRGHDSTIFFSLNSISATIYNTPTGRRLALFFIHSSKYNGGEWPCDEYNAAVSESISSHSCFLAHSRSNHCNPIDESIVRETVNNNFVLRSRTYNAKMQSVHAWIEMIAISLRGIPFADAFSLESSSNANLSETSKNIHSESC